MFTELFVYILYINTSQTSFLFFQQSRVPFGTYFYLHFPRLRGGTGTYHRHAQDESQQDPTPIWPLPCTATALWRARRFVVSMRRAADCMCLKVCMLRFLLILAVKNGDSFSGNDWSQTQFPIFCTCCLFQFQIYTGLCSTMLWLCFLWVLGWSQPHTVKIMSWRSSFQWSVKDIKGHLKQ